MNIFVYFVIDHKSQLEEDEQLARAIEESLNLESPPKHGNDNNTTYQPIQYFPMGYRYEFDDSNVHFYSHLFVLVLLLLWLRILFVGRGWCNLTRM